MTDSVRIQRIRRRPGSERLRIVLEDGTAVELAEALVLEAGLHAGDRVDPAVLDDLTARDTPYRAREAALNLLSYRARSTQELRRRLARKGFTDAVVKETVHEMESKGYLDDDAFAAAFVRDRLRSKPRGRRRLAAELRSKGIDADTADRAIRETFGEADAREEDLARELARAWAARNEIPDREADRDAWYRQRQRLYGYLARRGFAPDVVRDALRGVFTDD